MKRITNLSLATCLAVFVCAGSLATVDGCRRCFGPGDRQERRFEGWDCRDLVGRLREAGLDYRPVSTAANDAGERSVYLTKADKSWVELNGQSKVAEQIDHWRGSVYCERLPSPGLRDAQLRLWGDYGLEVGPFIFFGDPDMLAAIEAVLAQHN